MTEQLAAKWDVRYSDAQVGRDRACLALTENLHLLPKDGVALDWACGLAANALCLAQYGLNVDAWDLSPIVVEKVQRYAKQSALPIRCSVRDVIVNPPHADQYDAIVVAYFLWRPLFPHLIVALKPGGLLFYQTFTQEKVDGPDSGPSNPDFCLKPAELLSLCSELEVLVYREEIDQGDLALGLRNQAMIVARRPVN